MHKKHSRRRQIAIRSFTYGVMTLAVVFGIVFCVAWVMGFRFDPSSQQISQISLLQLASYPSGASVDINGERQSFKTPNRQNVKTGKITVNMFKDGYRDWEKTLNLRPSEVRWLTYARLIPREITTDSVRSFPDIREIVASPDKRYILVRPTDSNHELVLADISDPKNVRFSNWVLDEAAFSPKPDDVTETIAVVEWDKSSRYVLLKRAFGEQVEFIKIDRRNLGVAVNLTREFGMAIGDPHFIGNSGNVLYGLTDGALRKFDLGNKSVSAPLLTGVESYKLDAKNRATYVSTETKSNEKVEQKVGIYDDGSNHVVKTYDEILKTEVDLAIYSDEDYLAIARGDIVTLLKNPLSTQRTADANVKLSASAAVEYVEFNGAGRILIYGHGDVANSYDSETGEKATLTLNSGAKPLWLDDFHLVDAVGGEFSFVEFDGANRTPIVSGRGRATLSDNEKYFFSIGDSPSGAILQRSKLVIEP